MEVLTAILTGGHYARLAHHYFQSNALHVLPAKVTRAALLRLAHYQLRYKPYKAAVRRRIYGRRRYIPQ